MDLNALLKSKDIDPQKVLVFRHRPTEPELNRILPWLAAERPDLFNAYQQTQGKKLEKVMSSMLGTGYVASFIGHEAGKAIFVGLYSIGTATPLTYAEYWQRSQFIELKERGMQGFSEDGPRSSLLWFDLAETDFYNSWKGKLIVNWPPPERSWWRRAHRNIIPVHAVLEESALVPAMPMWDKMVISWNQLADLPGQWKNKLAEWRGIYYIFDKSVKKGYVGSAYGKDNLLGRWQNYAACGHGGNRLLRQLDPHNFQFSILQRVSPDTESEEIIKLESTWKDRLHTHAPIGLNDN